ncbi:hypothetical protein OEZ86_003379 [Tetradesmus obliquus]|nr:hypothetical protein OEZ86_003375 [Tetradesmus obliquus]WIA32572.1 hypothetical protein OEZ86_003379 [Tetradesmus obliquus]
MQATLARENMSTTPEAIERKIVAKEAEVELVKRQLQDASGDRELLLLQQLTALRQELAALQQQLVLLMQQQAAAAAAAAGGGGAPGGPKMRTAMDDIMAVYCAAVRVLTKGALGSDHEHVKAH